MSDTLLPNRRRIFDKRIRVCYDCRGYNLETHPEGWRDRPEETPATSWLPKVPTANTVPIPAGALARKICQVRPER